MSNPQHRHFKLMPYVAGRHGTWIYPVFVFWRGFVPDTGGSRGALAAHAPEAKRIVRISHSQEVSRLLWLKGKVFGKRKWCMHCCERRWGGQGQFRSPVALSRGIFSSRPYTQRCISRFFVSVRVIYFGERGFRRGTEW